MIRPYSCRYICGRAARASRNGASTISRRIRRNISGGNSSTGATCWIPALLTRMSNIEPEPFECGHVEPEPFECGHVGKVGRPRLATQFRGQGLGARSVLVGDDHRRARPGQGPRAGSADPAGRAGDQGPSASERPPAPGRLAGLRQAGLRLTP